MLIFLTTIINSISDVGFLLQLRAHHYFFNFNIHRKTENNSRFHQCQWIGLKEISETPSRNPTVRPDEVVLCTLLQGTRGLLLIIFNWILFIRFGPSSIPSLDIMAALPPSIYLFMGFIDILMVNRLWQGYLTGWRYGIIMSLLVLLFTPVMTLLHSALHIAFLYIIIDLFAVGEIIALVSPSARQFSQT